MYPLVSLLGPTSNPAKQGNLRHPTAWLGCHSSAPCLLYSTLRSFLLAYAAGRSGVSDNPFHPLCLSRHPKTAKRPFRASGACMLLGTSVDRFPQGRIPFPHLGYPFLTHPKGRWRHEADFDVGCCVDRTNSEVQHHGRTSRSRKLSTSLLQSGTNHPKISRLRYLFVNHKIHSSMT